MKRFAASAIVSALFVSLSISLSPVQAQQCFYVDFDDDNDPWTLRTQLPAGQVTATARFVFQAPEALPSGQAFSWDVVEGCCNDIFMSGHYGARWRFETVDFDPQFVAFFTPVLPICTFCCPWIIEGIFADPIQAVPGERYFIGQGVVDAYCEDFPPPCNPPHDFFVRFSAAGGCADGESDLMVFTCPTTGIPAEEPAGQSLRWSQIKAIYR